MRHLAVRVSTNGRKITFAQGDLDSANLPRKSKVPFQGNGYVILQRPYNISFSVQRLLTPVLHMDNAVLAKFESMHRTL